MKIDDSKVPNKNKYPFGAEQLTNRFIYEVLPDRSWKGKPCIVVGGGPSLTNFDWELLRGWRVIGVNRVYEKFDPTIIFSMDTRFLRWILNGKYGEEAREKFMASKAYKVWLCTYNCKLPPEIFIVKVWGNYSRGFRVFPDTMRNGIGHGNNSGYGALNLATCLGANPIYLRGPVNELHHISAKKGGYCSKHSHKKYNLFYVLSGQLKISIWLDEEAKEPMDITILGPEEVSAIPPELPHRFEALEDTECIELYYVLLEDPDIKRFDQGGMKE